MRITTYLLLVLTSTVIAAPASPLITRQKGKTCYLNGDTLLPEDDLFVSNSIEGGIKCEADGKTTISGAPDVLFREQAFSTIDFTQSNLSPLGFALDLFQTAEPVVNSDIEAFQAALAAYQATEISMISTGADTGAIDCVKTFIDFQLARIETAQGRAPSGARAVNSLRDDVLALASNENQNLKNQVNALASAT